MAKKKHNEMWGFAANSYCPWSNYPIKLEWSDDGFWWHDNGIRATEKGLDESTGYMCYISNDKKDVQRFIDGFFACRNLLKPFFEE